MCDNVIIHKKDGTEIICECQKDLMEQMPNGIWYCPPLTYAEWVEYFQDYSVPPTIIELIDFYGYTPTACLCPVNLKRTAKENGYMYSKDDPNGEWDAFDTHFYEE